jgi:Tfp pilus assembly protein PilO
MKRLSPAKRNQLIMVILGTAGIIALIYFILIQPQKDKNQSLSVNISEETTRLQQMKTAIKQRATDDQTLTETVQKISEAEQDIASGDVYAWTYDLIRRFKSAYRVEIPSMSQPFLGEVDLIASFPYKQVKVSLNGTAYYHDIGKFIADFENKYPHTRVVNLTVEPALTAALVGTAPGEQLSFHMEIVALVKPNS